MAHEEIQPSLFPHPVSEAPSPSTTVGTSDPEPVSQPLPVKASPRYTRPERRQVQAFCESLDDRLDADHPARLVWKLVEGLDLSVLYDRIRAVEGHVGRNASDPRVLFALWLYACVEGIGSARKLDEFCREHRAYEWLRGNVSVNYHLLADFRTAHQELLDQLLTDSLAGLLQEGLIDLKCTAQDGMRIRASAGKSSFKRQETLDEALKTAQERVAALRDETEAGAATQRQAKARERAAREREERLRKALENVEEIAKQRESRKKGDGAAARASTTDPDARNMKMPDGGFRPAFNAQFATDAESGIIVGVDVTNQGTDAGQMKPMVDQIEQRVGRPPEQMLGDGGFSTIDDIEATTQSGTTVFVPVKEAQKQIDAGNNPFAAKAGDSQIIGDWRVRMGTEFAKLIYKLRAQTAELTNANMRNRGLYSVNVRGLAKVKTILLWHVLAQNLLRAEILRAAKAAQDAQLQAS
jgi:transposase